MKGWFKKRKEKKGLAKHDAEAALSRNLPGLYVPAIGNAERHHYLLQQLDREPKIWARIFGLLCPHAQDETYESNEQSIQDDSCPLCERRDIAHCARVSRRWNQIAVTVMYHSIRIDPVHYCPLEGILADKRRRKSRLNHNAIPEDTATARLHLLARTLNERPHLGPMVLYLKPPENTRRTCLPDISRCVATMPNLRYIDFPSTVLAENGSSEILKQELVSKRDLRKMTFAYGAEQVLATLASGTLWVRLEVIELWGLTTDPITLRHALASLPNLHALKVTKMEYFTDEMLRDNPRLPPFPPLKELVLVEIPHVTAEGIASYLSFPAAQAALETLSLTTTGVHPSTIYTILSTAPSLTAFTIIETVTTHFPAYPIPPLASSSLTFLNYEISPPDNIGKFDTTVKGYYAYLTTSLITNRFPSLEELYVRDPDFPESLIDLAPPAPAFASDPDASLPRSPSLSPSFTPSHQRLSSNNPFLSAASPEPGPGLRKPLVVYSKGADEDSWNFSRVRAAQDQAKRGSGAPRPTSSYGLGSGLASPWGAGRGARQSVIVGNGYGGFLAIPADNGDAAVRPSSSAGEMGVGGRVKGHQKRGSEYDIWR